MKAKILAIGCTLLLSFVPESWAIPQGGTCLYNWKQVSNGNVFIHGFDHHVWDLVVAPQGSPLGPAVYACGDFVHADGQIVNHVAKWNGGQWSSLSTGLGNGLNDVCHVLALGPDGQLYAGGRFTSAGGVSVHGIARWNGSVWSGLGTGSVKGFLKADGTSVGSVYDLFFYDGNWGPGVSGNLWLLAGGSFGYANPPAGLALHNLARWNGLGWSSVGTYPNDGVDGSTVYFSTPQVNDFIEFDDGSGPAMYVTGLFTEAGGVPARSIARWAGGFVPLGTGIWDRGQAGFGQAAADFQGQLYVGGFLDHAGPAVAHNLGRWNGTEWSYAGGPALPFMGIAEVVEGLHSANLGNGTRLYMAGFFLEVSDPGGGPTRPARHIAQFNGQNWTKLGAGLGPDTNDELDPVDRPHAMVMEHRQERDGNCLYVGGQFQTAGTLLASSIARYCCNKTPFNPSELINAQVVNAGINFGFTDDGDGLPEAVACDDDVDIPVSPGTQIEACGLRFVVGTANDDQLYVYGSTEPTVVFAGPGNNRVIGSSYDDLIFGGSDDDYISAGEGDDQIYAGMGNDTLLGGRGDDRLIAGPGDDLLDSGQGLNAVDGGEGTDIAVVQPGDELLDVENVTTSAVIPAMGSVGRALLCALLLGLGLIYLLRRSRQTGGRPHHAG